ncbi:hypothetical protein BJD43_gp110 [Cyanophage S-RIM50]|jgi:cell division protein ZapA (FtsZ GTPase activity inhibitor)|uniref:Uncharacterized protein n=1 Tax=Cyanophage S-RIM50 TaxID=687803 RepID=A0A127KLQ2_9CAUD|nr:hypothetical protein BJD43_gp110 [Cyanophage S-RIM50]AMO42920.1 hypothetical protein R290704_138 [Cyanophage S-RIM50]
MKEEEKKILAQMQLTNVTKLLDGKLQHLTCSDYSGKVKRKYVIEYEDPSDN